MSHHLNRSTRATKSTAASSERGGSKWVRWVGVGVGSVALTLGLAACYGDANGENDHTSTDQGSSAGEGNGERSDEHGSGEGSGEHGSDGEGAEVGDGGTSDGEESGTELGLTETFDQVRAGARLILVYDSGANAFVGTVENVATGVLDRVRVEVHLSNGVELGPTTPVDLGPGESADVNLAATDAPFDGWSTHAEVGGSGAEDSGEHGSDGEGGEDSGEHGSGEQGA